MTEDKRSIIQMVAGLIEQGKKNQDKIAYSKILDTFSGVEISSEQFDNILKVLEDKGFKVATSLYEMVPFYEAEDYHQDYYERHQKVPYCHSYRKIF